MGERLRTLLVGADSPDSFAADIAAALRRAECEVHHYADHYKLFARTTNFALQGLSAHMLRFFPSLEDLVNRRLLRRALKLQPNLVLLCYSYAGPATIRALRQDTDAIVANWFPDALSNFDRQYIIGSDYHLLFFKDRYIVRFFREKIGMENCFYLPQCCDKDLHRPVELSEADRRKYGCDLTTAASLYYYRARLLEPFLDYDLKIWGNVPRWLDSPLKRKASGETVFGVDKARAFRAAKIVLNTQHFAEIEGVNKRTFEAAGCGAFQITDENPALSDLFDPGREIVTYSSRKDLKEKVDYYLAHARERDEIAERACRRAHAEHTYDHRVAVILSHVRLLRKSSGISSTVQRASADRV